MIDNYNVVREWLRDGNTPFVGKGIGNDEKTLRMLQDENWLDFNFNIGKRPYFDLENFNFKKSFSFKILFEFVLLKLNNVE